VPEPHPQMTAMMEMTLEELWLLGELRSFETTRLGPVLAYRRVGR
jgi:hypothetical protein